MPWYVTGQGLELPSYLLTLVAGWLVGFTFVGATLRMRHAGSGWIVHSAGAVVGAIVLFVGTQIGDALADLPQAVRGLIFFVQMAAIPAAGWTWVTLVGRLSRAAGSGSSKQPAPALPEWARIDDEWVLDITAVPVRIRILNLIAGVMWALAVAAVVMLMMVFYDLALRMGAGLVILALGWVVVLPAYGLYLAALRPRTQAVQIRLGRSAVSINDEVVAYRDLDEVLWREDGLYARLEFRARANRVGAYVVGVARRPKTVAPGLPPLPKSALRAIEAAGLESGPISRRARGVVFRRESPGVG